MAHRNSVKPRWFQLIEIGSNISQLRKGLHVRDMYCTTPGSRSTVGHRISLAVFWPRDTHPLPLPIAGKTLKRLQELSRPFPNRWAPLHVNTWFNPKAPCVFRMDKIFAKLAPINL